MAKKEDLEKVTFNMTKGDKELLTQFYPVIGWSVAARRIIRNHCQVKLEKINQVVMTDAPDIDVDIPLEDIKET